MEITVVVTSFNSAETLDLCLKSISVGLTNNDELIVVDDGGGDASVVIAKKLTNKVIHINHGGRSRARLRGWQEAKGEVVVNVDSDVVINPDSISVIKEFFYKHKDIDAITGKLAKVTPIYNFVSQYKNLYMYYVFNRLPERVSFLYGSIFAIRRGVTKGLTQGRVKIADDTDLGQWLTAKNKQIVLLKDLEVVHLKKYSVKSLLINDFRIPYDWAQIFWSNRGWKQLGRNQTGFAHASKSQLVSVVLVPGLVIGILGGVGVVGVLAGLAGWTLLNAGFFRFLINEKGWWFGVRAVGFTFVDQLVMFSGIVAGSVLVGFNKLRLIKSAIGE